MKIDTEDLLTIEQAAKAIGAPNRRSAYRALKRAEEAGKPLSVALFGKTLVPRANVEELRQYYYPYYSEQHQRMVKQWGAAGGRAGGVTKRARKQAQAPAAKR
jgi:hypothetical protein